ncbi:phage integrase SAM-like domain-containing protein [Desulfocapsa sulfexigens]|nr:phage integrase SAM-like domain-containing protein [Desulfocapsa sulfexigens]
MNIRTNVINFTKEKIQHLVKEYIGDTLAKDEYCRFHPSKTVGTKVANKEEVSEDNEILMLVTQLLDSMEHFDSNSHSPKDNIQNILRKVKLLVGGEIACCELIDEGLTSSFKKPRNILQGSSINLNATKYSAFSEVEESYILEVEKGGNWTEKTKAENLTIFTLFMRIVGDLPVEQIDRKVMTEYKSILMQLPPNLNKGSRYEGKTVAEIIDSRPEKTLTVNTINKYIRRLSGLFNYAVRNGHMQYNPAEGLQIKSQKRADQERQEYTNEDLQNLFGSKEYMEGKHKCVFQ